MAERQILLYDDPKRSKNRLKYLRRCITSRNEIKRNLDLLGVPFSPDETPVQEIKFGKFGTVQIPDFHYTNYIFFMAQKKAIEQLGYTKNDLVDMKFDAVVKLANYQTPSPTITVRGLQLGRDKDVMKLAIINDEGYLEERPSGVMFILDGSKVYISGSDIKAFERLKTFARTYGELRSKTRGYKGSQQYMFDVPILPTLKQVGNAPIDDFNKVDFYMELDEFNAIKDIFK